MGGFRASEGAVGGTEREIRQPGVASRAEVDCRRVDCIQKGKEWVGVLGVGRAVVVERVMVV